MTTNDRAISIFALDITYKIGPFTFLFEGARADLDAGLSNRVVGGNVSRYPHRWKAFTRKSTIASGLQLPE